MERVALEMGLDSLAWCEPNDANHIFHKETILNEFDRLWGMETFCANALREVEGLKAIISAWGKYDA